MFLKAFIRLFLAASIPLVILIFPLEVTLLDRINLHFWQERIDRTFQGTFKLLEEKLTQHPQEQWPEQFVLLTPPFSYDLNLRPLSYYEGKESIFSCLKKRQSYCIIDNDDVVAVHTLVQGSSWVIEMYIDQTDQEDMRRNIQGTVSLLNDKFPSDKQDLWPSRLTEVQNIFAFPVDIVSADQLPLSSVQRLIFEKKGTVSIDTDEGTLVYHQTSPDKPIFSLGPLPITESTTSIFLLILAVLLGSVSIGLLSFVFILWRDIRRLIRVATQFGDGHLAVRSMTKKHALLAPLAKSFDAMADNIQTTIISQSNLTNAIAHDLRTPLSRLSFATEMLDSDDLSTEDKQRYTQAMTGAIDTLDHLIKQMLVLARYSRAMNINHFSNTQLANELTEEVELFAQDYPLLSINLMVADEVADLTMFIDRRAIIRALTNLVNNAARFAKSKIVIQLESIEQHYILTVCDDGPGIPVEDRELVLKPFTQLNNDTRDKDTEHGLGLAIVAQIAKWHRGKVDIFEADIGGAKISLSWPQDIKQNDHTQT